MKEKIIDGKQIAAIYLDKISNEINQLLESGYTSPKLAVILIGEDPASSIYVKRKQNAAHKVGIETKDYVLSNDLKESELLNIISELNSNSDINGILVQLPLPSHIDQQKIIEAISPLKDVDGFHPINIGKLAQRSPSPLRPCTPAGIIKLLEHIGYNPRGKEAVVIGASNIVGRPMSLELLMARATVTSCHRFTSDLQKHVNDADIVVSAVGKPNLIDGSWIKNGSVVIDVGINRLPSGKIVGDVDFEEAIKSASKITPVPGGVGPMTVMQLMDNTLKAYKMHNGLA